MRALLLLLLLAFVGCDASGPADGLRLTTDAETYTPEATVTLTLTNASASSVGVHPDLCGAFPQIRRDAGWSAAPPYARLDLVCTQVITTLRPGAQLTVPFPLDATESGAGTYRFAYPTADTQVVSNTFEIRE